MVGPTMHVTAKVDYAVRAMVELAAAGGGPVKGEAIANAQAVPLRFLENILIELRHATLGAASAVPTAVIAWRVRRMRLPLPT